MSARTSRTSCCDSSRRPTSTSPGLSAASSTSTRSTRSPARPTTRRSPATSRARASSRGCSRSSRARSPTCRRRVGASIPTRTSSRSTRRTSCSSAAAPSRAWRRSSRSASASGRWASARRRRRPRPSASKILEHLMPEDLLKFGLIPEFVGRLPVEVTLIALTRDDLMRVLTEPQERGHPAVPEVPAAGQGGAGLHARRDRGGGRARARAQDRRAGTALDHRGVAARGDVRHPGAHRRPALHHHRGDDPARVARHCC